MREAASLISRALISASNNSKPRRAWTRSLEQTLHQLGCRDLLTPSLVARVIDPHLLHHPSLSLGFFNWASQQPHFSHSSISYHSILKSLSRSPRRQSNSLVQLIKEAKSRRFPVHPSIYRSIIASLVKAKKPHEAYLLLSDVLSFMPDIGVQTCNSLLAGLLSDGYFDCARKVFDEMLVRGVSFTTLGFALFMWSSSRTCQLDQVLGILDRVRAGIPGFDGSIVALLIIHGLCEVGRVSEAYTALKELRNRDFKPDFMAYRIVAEAFRSKGMGCIFEVQMVLKKKRKLGVAPRAGDYRDFIFALLSENLINEAKDLGQMIVDGNFPIADDVLNALIGSVSLVDPCSAMLFFKFMVGNERTPALLTLSNFGRNLCKHDKIDNLLEVFGILSSKDYFTNLESYDVMVSSFCEAGRVREAYGVLHEMRKKGLFPDISFYNTLMEALCNEDLLRPARKLWDEMFACGVDANLKTYNILIKKFSETVQVDEAQLLFDHMLQKGVNPDTATYTFLLGSLCQALKFEAAIQIFYKAAAQDVGIAQNIVTALIRVLCKGGHFLYASRFLCSNCHLRPTESHVVLLKHLADAKEFETAINHLKQVMAVSASLLQEISTDMLALLSSSSNPEPILELFQEMQQNGFTSMNENWRAFHGQLVKWDSEVTHQS